jgi:hypothetical protein
LDHIIDNGGARRMSDLIRAQAVQQQKITDPVIPAFKGLTEYIQAFESELDDEHEVGARLVSFGSAIQFHVESVGYKAPSLVTFIGVTDAGDRVQLVQHVSQLSFLLVAVRKREEKPYRVGFHAD